MRTCLNSPAWPGDHLLDSTGNSGTTA